MTELRECPFCGCDSVDYMPDRLMAPGAEPPVFCNECHASAMDASAWNRRADAWQPIETAPRDGTRVIVCAGKWEGVAYWNTNPQLWEGDDLACWTVFEPDDYFYAVHLRGDDCPTHWRPLPKGPGG